MSWVGRICRVYNPETGLIRDGKVIDSGDELENNQVRVEYLWGNPRVVDVTIGEEGMLLCHNEEPLAVMRRAPTGFAHAILCDQGGSERCWLVVDAYGAMEMTNEDRVRGWEPVYVPDHDAEWAARHRG